MASQILFSIIKIILILAIAYFASQFLKTLIKKTIQARIKDKAEEKRIKTLMGVLGGASRFIIWIMAILMILPEFKINIAPILAGVGLVGLAVSMAAKDIISDFIAGLFIILEDQYAVGDKVKIGEFEGKVKEITLRRTIIENEDGVLHLIPNSQIKIVSNKSKSRTI